MENRLERRRNCRRSGRGLEDSGDSNNVAFYIRRQEENPPPLKMDIPQAIFNGFRRQHVTLLPFKTYV
jgi:hypothetical protein